MARTYARDRRGRFSSTGATARGGRLTTASGRRYTTQTKRIGGTAPAGTLGKRKRTTAKTAPASNIRATGGLKRIEPGNSIKSTRRARRGPLVVKANAVRAFNPKTPRLRIGQLERQADRRISDIDKSMKDMKQSVSRIKQISSRFDRMNAKAMQDRLSKSSADRFMAGIEIGILGTRKGQRVIRRRMERAAAAAARGSKPAARAQQIYANQMAFMGSGKAKAAKSNIRPGPRNTQGPPKRKRRRKAK